MVLSPFIIERCFLGSLESCVPHPLSPDFLLYLYIVYSAARRESVKDKVGLIIYGTPLDVVVVEKEIMI